MASHSNVKDPEFWRIIQNLILLEHETSHNFVDEKIKLLEATSKYKELSSQFGMTLLDVMIRDLNQSYANDIVDGLYACRYRLIDDPTRYIHLHSNFKKMIS